MAKSLGLCFILVVLVPLPFLILGYDKITLSLFSLSLLLVWADAFLTLFSLRIGAKEINPLMTILCRVFGRKKGLFTSRLFGSALLLHGMIREDQHFLLVVSWIFAIVVCINSVSLLEGRVGERRKPTEADRVYELFREELEKEYFGKIVAVDTDSKQIVGMGDTLLEAYNNAKEKTGKDQFDFKRVGYKYIH